MCQIQKTKRDTSTKPSETNVCFKTLRKHLLTTENKDGSTVFWTDFNWNRKLGQVHYHYHYYSCDMPIRRSHMINWDLAHVKLMAMASAQHEIADDVRRCERHATLLLDLHTCRPYANFSHDSLRLIVPAWIAITLFGDKWLEYFIYRCAMHEIHIHLRRIWFGNRWLVWLVSWWNCWSNRRLCASLNFFNGWSYPYANTGVHLESITPYLE